MNSYFTVRVKYTKQLQDGTFKRVSEPYLLAAMTFTDSEARIYEELGALIRGEFMVTGISRTDIHDIFHYEDSETWWKCKINFLSGGDGEEGGKAKKVSKFFLVSANNEIEAAKRLRESLGGMLIDFEVPNVAKSPIVDIFPFGYEEERIPAKALQVSGEPLGLTSDGFETEMGTKMIDSNESDMQFSESEYHPGRPTE